MIRNDRQAAVARRKLEELAEAHKAATEEEKEIYRELIHDLESELKDFELVKSGTVNLFDIGSIDDIGPALIRARLARGWTQRQLADALGVSEQMVQKDESRFYENVGLARLAELIDILGYRLVGAMQPCHLPRRYWRSMAQVTFGIPSLTCETLLDNVWAGYFEGSPSASTATVSSPPSIISTSEIMSSVSSAAITDAEYLSSPAMNILTVA